MSRKPRLAFIAQTGPAGAWRPELFDSVAGRDDEAEGARLMLKSLGLLEHIEFVPVQTHQGEPIPDIDAFDAAILGGSFASVHDDHDWQQAVRRWLGQWRQAAKPLLAICGGHQQVAMLLGGTVERVPNGPETGCLPLSLTEAGKQHFLFDGFDETSEFFFGNFDRVAGPPPGSILLGHRSKVPAAALDHGGNWVSVQFHPETNVDRMATCWIDMDMTVSRSFHAIPDCSRMVGNFLRGTGIVPV